MAVLEPEGLPRRRRVRPASTLRIALFCAQYGRVTNGVGTYGSALADGLSRAGHSVTLVTAGVDPAIEATAAGAQIRTVKPSPLDPTPGGWLSLAREFAREARALASAGRADLLHFADAREVLFVPALDVATVGSVHDDYAAAAPAGPIALRRIHPDAWRRAAYYAVLRRLERRAYRRLDRLIANSRAVARSVSDAYRIPLDLVDVIHPAIPKDRPLAPGEKLQGDPAVLFVGTNFFRKGLGTLLHAASRLAAGHTRLTVTVVGGDARRRAAEAMVHRLGLSGRVRFLGHRDRREVQELYGRADLLAVPSHTEGFGLVFLEAMRAGTPVIAGRAGGTPELVRDGVDGLLVPPGDAAALAAAIERLHADRELRARLVASGRRRLESFSLEACLSQTLAAYDRAIERRLG